MTQQITKEFLEMKKISEFSWQLVTDCLSSEELQQEELLEITIDHPIAKLYSPSTEYIKAFIKALIKKIEAINIEVSEGIYKLLVEYLNDKPKNEYYYRTYSIYDGLQITLQETNSLVSNGTTGLTTWQASHVLAQFCIEDKLDKFEIRSSNILELGCGLGLTGLSIIKATNPTSYTFSDHHHAVLQVLKHNIFINLKSEADLQMELEDSCDLRWGSTEVKVKTIDWEYPEDHGEYDLVLGADLLFDLHLILPLINVITKSLKSSDSKAIIAATLRSQETIDYFLMEIEKSNLLIEQTLERSYQKSCSTPEETIKIFCISKQLLPIKTS